MEELGVEIATESAAHLCRVAAGPWTSVDAHHVTLNHRHAADADVQDITAERCLAGETQGRGCVRGPAGGHGLLGRSDSGDQPTSCLRTDRSHRDVDSLAATSTRSDTRLSPTETSFRGRDANHGQH